MATRRPDGGWGWVIVAAAFGFRFILDGVKYSFGFMYSELLDAFHGTSSQTSWIISIQVAVSLAISPVTGALINRFGCRKVTALGSLIAFAGFLASSFATSVSYLYVTFGIVGGIGFGIGNMPLGVSVARYFDRRLALAAGISATGSGSGMLLFGPLSKLLIDAYTWRGLLLVESAMILNGLLCASVLRPVPERTLETVVEQTLNDSPDQETKQLNQNVDEYFEEKQNLNNHTVIHELKSLYNDDDVQETLLLESNSCDIHESEPHYMAKDIKGRKHDTNVHDATLYLNDTEVPDVGNRHTINDVDLSDSFGGCEDSTTFENNGKVTRRGRFLIVRCDSRILDTSPQAEEVHCSETKRYSVCCCITGTTCRCISACSNQRWLSLSPLKEVRFLLFICSNMLMELSLMTPFTFLPDMMSQKGHEKKAAVFMMFLIGLLSTLARVISGWVADLHFISRVKLCYSVMMLLGVIVALCPLCSNYASYTAFAVIFGFISGSSSALRGILVPDLFGINMIADRMGICSFFSSCAALVGLPITAAIYDVSQSYTAPFLVAGIEMVASGVVALIITLLTKQPAGVDS